MSNWEQIPNDARVWVYQSSKFLSDDQSSWLMEEAGRFVSDWASHGSDLAASVHVFENLFLVFFVDETRAGASGCSIDKSVRFVKQMESELSVSFFDRLKICLVDGEEKRLVPLSNLGDVDSDTRFYNNAIKTKFELQHEWLLPVYGSWLDRFLEVKPV